MEYPYRKNTEISVHRYVLVLSKTAVTPTEIASWPIPENHLDTFPDG
jgi:hypothetical protein